eukprot:366396-Alexandrium_andersonii.AAC.1
MPNAHTDTMPRALSSPPYTVQGTHLATLKPAWSCATCVQTGENAGCGTRARNPRARVRVINVLALGGPSLTLCCCL